LLTVVSIAGCEKSPAWARKPAGLIKNLVDAPLFLDWQRLEHRLARQSLGLDVRSAPLVDAADIEFGRRVQARAV
jgi:hypothetical protein